MTQSINIPATQEPYCPDDIVVWPDGGYAELRDVRDGHYDWRSDDYEVVRLENATRLRELGLDELLDDSPG